ncbi:MAG TPA: CPBP family intramembrane glutamic endopeptidase [Puia sp.]|nr:CPBP family intramembrane glutamic endopeptidase [Puia sp.]
MTTVFVAVLIAINYSIGIERRIQAFDEWYWVFGCQALFFGAVVVVVWGFQVFWGRSVRVGDGAHRGAGEGVPVRASGALVRPLVAAVLLFSAKMVHWDLSSLLPGDPGSAANRYWVIVTQLPAKLVVFVSVIWVLWRAGWLAGPLGGGFREAVGLKTTGFHAGPYFGLLLLVVPLVALASTQADFLRIYPKVKNIAFMRGYPGPLWIRQAGYELAYGLDFFSIELFFRGLLVVGLIRYAGERAILPMAAWYCTIHFGKPIGECITSFAGGMILGVLAYRTRTVLGGLIVHLGLAWMMEVGGWLGGPI